MRAIKDRMVRSYRFLFSFSLYSSCFSHILPFFFISFRFLISRRCLSCHRRRIEKEGERKSLPIPSKSASSALLPSHAHTHTQREREWVVLIVFFSLPDVVVCVSHSFPFFSYIRLCRGDIFHLGGWIGWWWFFLPLLVISPVSLL